MNKTMRAEVSASWHEASDAIALALGVATPASPPVDPPGDIKERRAPTAESLARRDVIVAAVEAVTSEIPAGYTLTVGRVSRVTEPDEEHEDSGEPLPGEKYTAIPIEVSTPLYDDRTIAVRV